MKGRYIRKIPQYAKDPADQPGFKLEEISEVSKVRVDDSEYLMVIPLDRWESFMDFDRNVAKLGHEEFVRPAMDSDTMPPSRSAKHLLVVGDEQMRIRLPVEIGEETGKNRD